MSPQRKSEQGKKSSDDVVKHDSKTTLKTQVKITKDKKSPALSCDAAWHEQKEYQPESNNLIPHHTPMIGGAKVFACNMASPDAHNEANTDNPDPVNWCKKFRPALSEHRKH